MHTELFDFWIENITRLTMERDEVRATTLEEAAKVCEGERIPYNVDHNRSVNRCANAIRNLE